MLDKIDPIVGGAAIFQWIRLCLHPTTPGSSPKHIIYTFSFIVFVLYLSCEKNENKQKEVGFGPFLKDWPQSSNLLIERLLPFAYDVHLNVEGLFVERERQDDVVPLVRPHDEQSVNHFRLDPEQTFGLQLML